MPLGPLSLVLRRGSTLGEWRDPRATLLRPTRGRTWPSRPRVCCSRHFGGLGLSAAKTPTWLRASGPPRRAGKQRSGSAVTVVPVRESLGHAGTKVVCTPSRASGSTQGQRRWLSGGSPQGGFLGEAGCRPGGHAWWTRHPRSQGCDYKHVPSGGLCCQGWTGLLHVGLRCHGQGQSGVATTRPRQTSSAPIPSPRSSPSCCAGVQASRPPAPPR